VVLGLAEIGRELPYPRFGVTLTEELLAGLGERLDGRMSVVSGTLERLRREHREPDAGDLLLEGSVRADEQQISIGLRLSELEQGLPLWSRRFEFPRGEAGECCDRRIVARLIDSLAHEIGMRAGSGWTTD
jgi:TolB-like protein